MVTGSNPIGWPKKITVDKRIVSLLSKSTYEKFPMAIRETVSNAYDADATSVNIEINLDKHQMSITDNGVGMTSDEFDFYLRIAGNKRGKTASIKFKRKRIGQLGVGFLAIFPFCTHLEVTSTVENSDKIFTARIPSSQFIEQSSGTIDVSEIPVEGYEITNPEERQKHYTILKLVGITPLVYEYFTPKLKQYKKSPNDINAWDGFKKLEWELCETLPLDYPENSELAKSLQVKPVGMEVKLNGKRLFRNEFGGEVLDNNQGNIKEVGDIKFRYAIMTKWESILPYNARGLKIRLKNVGVGERTFFDLGIHGRTWSRLHWISGEIQILEGLDESIALDRESFTWSNRYEEFRDFFRSLLSDLLYKIENVAAPEKKIADLIKSGSLEITASKVEEYLDLLPEDYKIIRKKTSNNESEVPVLFDKVNKQVTLIEDHKIFKETTRVGTEDFVIKYGRWDYLKSSNPACRKIGLNIYEVNMGYPLFNKSKNKDILIKIHLIILIASEKSNNTKDMYKFISKELEREYLINVI